MPRKPHAHATSHAKSAATARPPDAVLVPLEKAEELGKVTLYQELVQTLGGPVQFGKDSHTGLKFGRLDPNEIRLYPHGHPWSGQDRYEWFVAERSEEGVWTPVMPWDGEVGDTVEVLLGYLREDPHAETAETKAAVAEAWTARMAEFKASAEYRAMMRRLQGGKDDATDE